MDVHGGEEERIGNCEDGNDGGGLVTRGSVRSDEEVVDEFLPGATHTVHWQGP